MLVKMDEREGKRRRERGEGRRWRLVEMPVMAIEGPRGPSEDRKGFQGSTALHERKIKESDRERERGREIEGGESSGETAK